MKVLFLDDDARYLRILQVYFQTQPKNALAQRGLEAEFVARFEDAVTILDQKEVALFVTDLEMPGQDGLRVLEILHRNTPDLPKAVVTSFTDAAYRRSTFTPGAELGTISIPGFEGYRRACLAAGASLFLAKPSTLAEVNAVLDRLIELVRPAPPAAPRTPEMGSEGFTGLLRRASLYDMIQMLCLSQASIVLEVQTAVELGRIYIHGGNVVHATFGASTGEEALYVILSARGGTFEMKPLPTPPEPTIHQNWQSVLMEGARLQDEADA